MSADERLREGVILFNRRSYFESHEIWEELWREAEEPEKRFLGALVQIAAALHLRFERGGGRGTRNLLVQSLMILDDFRPRHRGLDLERLHGEVQSYAERLEETKGAEAGWIDRWLAPRIRECAR
jgi:uncharacterized protein